MKQANSSSWPVSAAVFALGLVATPVSAQITPDATLPNNSVVLPNGNIITIEGGTEAGTNLFHSFSDFDLPTGSEAFFNNATSIDNIITRVTGGNLSDIDGLIRANGTANLFLINPNGIQFGPNASLDIGGSFLGSTAESLLFEDGRFYSYSATEPDASPLLSVNVPMGLQMGASPGNIQVTGTGQGIIVNRDPLFSLPSTRLTNPANLETPSGKTLALVGGNVTLQGSALRANEGRIELGGASRGVVGLQPIPLGWTLDYNRASTDRDVRLQSQSAIDASGFTSGGIQLVGDRIQLQDGSVATIQVLDDAPTAQLNVTATELVEISGFDAPRLLASALSVANFGAGEVGDITVTAPNLAILDGGEINLTHLGSAPGSNVNLNISQNLLVSGRSPLNILRSSRLGTSNIGTGEGGDVNIFTRTLRVDGGGQVGSTAGSPSIAGRGGDVIIEATDSIEIIGPPITDQLELIDSSFINSGTAGRSDGGRVIVSTARLSISDGGDILSATLSSGNAGAVVVNASESVELSGTEGKTTINSAALPTPAPEIQIALGLPAITSGNAGQVTVNTPQLRVSGISDLSVANVGTGSAGDLDINAGTIILDEGGILSASTLSGEGGNLNLQASESLVLRNGSQISATAGGVGNGGSLSIDTPLLVAIPRENSDIIANAFEGTGGNIEINAQGIFGLENRSQLTLQSDITASSQFGVDGIVAINNPIVDPASGLVALDAEHLDPDTQVQNSCAKASGNQFVITGRGSLPEDPSQLLRGETIWSDLRALETWEAGEIRDSESIEPLQSQIPDAPPLVEATGWRTNARGQVELVVTSGNPTHSSWQPHPDCDSVSQQSANPQSPVW